MNNIDNVEKLRRKVVSAIDPMYEEYASAMSAYYSQLFEGYELENFNKAEQRFIAAMETILRKNKK